MIITPKIGIKLKKWDLTSKDIEKRIDIVKELLSLSKEEYREVMENKLKELYRGVKAFKEIAKRIIDTKDIFYVCPILAEVRDKEMHMATKASEDLDGLPVYIRHLDYTPELKLFTFKVFLPATKDMLENFTYDEIALEQKKIIEKTLDEIDNKYKKELLLKIELDKRIPSPIRRIYNRDGCWLSWVFKMFAHPEFWTMRVSELPYATRIPFIATPYYEFVMLMSDRTNYPHMSKVKDELTKEAENRHSIRLSKVEDIEISYSWFEKKGLVKEIKQAGKIDEKIKSTMSMELENNLTSKGHKVSGMILGEEDKTPTGKDAEKDIEIASTIWEEEIIKIIPNFGYKDETFEKCVIKGEFKMELL